MGPKWITTSQLIFDDYFHTFIIGFEKSPQRIGTNTQQRIHFLKLQAGEQKTTFAFGGAESS